jgi:ribonuclease VapC
MIVIDASAVIAILMREPGWETVVQAMQRATSRQIGAIALWEAAATLLARGDEDPVTTVQAFLEAERIEIAPVSADQTLVAIEARKTFGKGRHPAKLNLGDCFAYALARAMGAPLLFVGADFPLTDIPPALEA